MIHVTTDLIPALSLVLHDVPHDRLFVLADENTARYCLPMMEAMAEEYRLITIGIGDEHKTLTTLATVWDALEEGEATRHSLLMNVGGGVVTDLGGFAAATFKRGIKYINVPTTLLAMVDAAVGGKTAINYHGLKNEIGAFCQPEHVIISPRFLATLDRKNLLSGMAEMFKHILINEAAASSAPNEYEALSDIFATFLHTPDEGVLQAIADAIAASIAVKERIVTIDPTEQGLRKALNFGHTMGHAIEELLLQQGHPVLHGYAVAWGMTGELYLSHMKCGLSVGVLRQTTRQLRELYGPCPITCKDYDALLSLMHHDKKNLSADAIRFALLSAPGRITLDCTASHEEIEEALDFIRVG